MDLFSSSFNFQDFQGACVNTGATESVLGRFQAEAYSNFTGNDFLLQKNRKHRYRYFTFGKQRIASCGKIWTRIPIGKEFSLSIKIDVVDISIAFLIGLNTMDKYMLYANIVSNLLILKTRMELSGR